jgi:hypothetical protein
MKRLILREYNNRIIDYNVVSGPYLLTNELENLYEESGQLYEQRKTFLKGIRWYKREVVCDITDEYGLDDSGELLRFRSHYTLRPAPTALRNFEDSTRVIMWLVRILRGNCFEIKRRLNTMRTIIDEVNDNQIDIPNILHEIHLNFEKLYVGIQVDIGFLANTVSILIG